MNPQTENKSVMGYALWMRHPDYVRFVRARPGEFGKGFGDWLAMNAPIWDRFKSEADRIRRRRDHYSARTIVEFIRHETALAEPTGAYKINDHACPDLARLYMLTTPGAEKFFEVRGRNAAS